MLQQAGKIDKLATGYEFLVLYKQYKEQSILQSCCYTACSIFLLCSFYKRLKGYDLQDFMCTQRFCTVTLV